MAKKVENKPIEIGKYQLVSLEKLDRVINGDVGSGGKLIGGLGKDAPIERILAEYDKLGGLILKDGQKLETGSFYDFENKKDKIEPNIVITKKPKGGIKINEEEVGDSEMPKKGRKKVIEE